MKETILNGSSFFSIRMNKTQSIKICLWIGNRLYHQSLYILIVIFVTTSQEASVLICLFDVLSTLFLLKEISITKEFELLLFRYLLAWGIEENGRDECKGHAIVNTGYKILISVMGSFVFLPQIHMLKPLVC